MRPVMYSMTVSLDGYIADRDGNIDWTAPDEELHRFHNQQTRELAAHLCGRRLYEAMLVWDRTDGSEFGAVGVEFAQIWKPIDKVVFSHTLSGVEGNARLASRSVAEELSSLREAPDDRAIGVGGADLAAQLVRLDLVDEYHRFVAPVVLGGGTPYFPALNRRLECELLETRRFGSGVVYSRYRRVR